MTSRSVIRSIVSPFSRSVVGRLIRIPTTQEIINLLFGDSQQGAFYVPRPIVDGMQSLYQDAAATTPVASDGDPVGWMRDLSGNGNHATQSTSADRPIYRSSGGLHWIESNGVNHWLTTPGTASLFKFLHDGTGGCVSSAVRFLAEDDLSVVSDTYGATGANVGTGIYRLDRTAQSEDDGYSFEVARGVNGSFVARVRSTTGSIASGEDYILRGSYVNNGLSDDAQLLKDSEVLGEAATDNAPSTSDSENDLRIFRAATIYSTMRNYGMVIVSDPLKGTSGQDVDNYLAGLQGRTL